MARLRRLGISERLLQSGSPLPALELMPMAMAGQQPGHIQIQQPLDRAQLRAPSHQQ